MNSWPGSIRQPSSNSPRTGRPRSCAAAITAASLGTPGLLMTLRAPPRRPTPSLGATTVTPAARSRATASSGTWPEVGPRHLRAELAQGERRGHAGAGEPDDEIRAGRQRGPGDHGPHSSGRRPGRTVAGPGERWPAWDERSPATANGRRPRRTVAGPADGRRPGRTAAGWGSGVRRHAATTTGGARRARGIEGGDDHNVVRRSLVGAGFDVVVAVRPQRRNGCGRRSLVRRSGRSPPPSPAQFGPGNPPGRVHSRTRTRTHSRGLRRPVSESP